VTARLVEYLSGALPVTESDVKLCGRIPDESITAGELEPYIFAAVQAAEAATGAAIRKARYIDSLPSLTAYPLSRHPVVEIESIAQLNADGSTGNSIDSWHLRDEGSQTLITASPSAPALVTYTAGIDGLKTAYPSVWQWVVLASVWLYDHRDLSEPFPYGLSLVLLQPISQPPRS